MNPDPNSEGDFENGCHHWLSDSLSLTIETDADNHNLMLASFRYVRDTVKLPADTPDYVAELVRVFQATMREATVEVVSEALSELQRCTDPDDIAELQAASTDPEMLTDLQNWFYRRYKRWQNDNA